MIKVDPTTEALYRRAELSTYCTYCSAAPGNPCRAKSGRWRRNPHEDRVRLLIKTIQQRNFEASQAMSRPLNAGSPQGVEEFLRELKRLSTEWVNSGDPAMLTLAAQLQGVIDHHLNSKES